MPDGRHAMCFRIVQVARVASGFDRAVDSVTTHYSSSFKINRHFQVKGRFVRDEIPRTKSPPAILMRQCGLRSGGMISSADCVHFVRFRPHCVRHFVHTADRIRPGMFQSANRFLSATPFLARSFRAEAVCKSNTQNKRVRILKQCQIHAQLLGKVPPIDRMSPDVTQPTSSCRNQHNDQWPTMTGHFSHQCSLPKGAFL